MAENDVGGRNVTIGVDVGGTFTDFFCDTGSGTVTTKVPTTHYDLSVSFMRGLRQIAQQLDVSLEALLKVVQAIRYSTTVGTNALIERNGPKLGLFTTAGFEDGIYIGRARSWADGVNVEACRDQASILKPVPLIEPDMVVGVRERIDCTGRVIVPLSRNQVLDSLQDLVDRGAQGFVVALLWSFLNPRHEQMIKEIIAEEYPEDYLGSMPVILSTDISPKAGEYTRTMTAVVNAYIHNVMTDEIATLSNQLWAEGYRRPLMLVHNTGGVKKAARTRAVSTHNAGPVAGLHGAALLGELSGVQDIVFADMGGTSFDIGVIDGGVIKAQDFISVIDRWRTNIHAIEVKSIGAGGGSIAWVNALLANSLEVGPQSAGSMPGPACYDQGGQLPTVTDADVVLGIINPENYLGGQMVLDVDLSREAIARHIGDPLGIECVEAAFRIRELVDARMGHEVFNEVALKGHDPRRFTLLACGGAGGAHACGFARYLGTQRILLPRQSPVFGAFGTSALQTREVWERSRSLTLFDASRQSYLTDLHVFNTLVEELKELATADLQLEGYEEDQITFALELDMRYGSQHKLTTVAVPSLLLSGPRDAQALCDVFTRRYGEIYSPEATFPSGGIKVEAFYLTATVARPPPRIQTSDRAAAEPEPGALRGLRPVCWNPRLGYTDTRVFDFASLVPGNLIVGPAIVESSQTTYVVDPGWRFSLDVWGNGVLEKVAA